MHRALKTGLIVAACHAVVPLATLAHISTLDDGTQRWAATLPMMYLDAPLLPIFDWLGSNPDLSGSSAGFMKCGVSLLLGSLMYGTAGAAIVAVAARLK